MKSLLKVIVVLVVLIAVGGVGYSYLYAYWTSRQRPEFRTSDVIRGEITSVVNATGTAQPKLRVQVGSVVSGPIVKLNVDYNDRVRGVSTDDDLSPEEKEKYLLVKIDPRIYEAAKTRDEAALARAKAELERVKALLGQAENDYGRAKELAKEDPDYISGTEMDQYKYSFLALKAQCDVAAAALDQAEANLENSKANLGYTEIYSPVDGIVIDRKIDKGQTLAAQFQTPVLFVVAPDMDKEMYVEASVDEADIGLIRKAQESDQPVFFTVDAYPDDLFEGRIYQIRKNPTTTQNVVTYPVLVTVANPDLKLLPGMTANLSFQIEQHKDVLKVPNAALRFYPKKEHVRAEDQKILEGEDDQTDSDQIDEAANLRSAMQRIVARKDRNRRHVWIQDGEHLRAVRITVGLSDYKYSEVLAGEIEEGQSLVTGVE
jgi:HlyD family secretion protein